VNARFQHLQPHSQVSDSAFYAPDSSTPLTELRSIIETLQANEQMLQTRYENTEMERVRAVGAEHQGMSCDPYHLCDIVDRGYT